MNKTIIADEPTDYFKWKSGSNIWPSSDPNDSPFDTFTCKLCGWSSRIRIYGNFPMGTDPWDEVQIRISEHLRVKHKIETSLKIKRKEK